MWGGGGALMEEPIKTALFYNLITTDSTLASPPPPPPPIPLSMHFKHVFFLSTKREDIRGTQLFFIWGGGGEKTTQKTKKDH